MEESILFEVQNGVGIVRLNRPDSLNALNISMREKLNEIFTGLNTREDIRVLVILGNGDSFCAGQDLKEGSLTRRITEHLDEKWAGDFQTRLTELKIPVIVGMQGYTIGRGLELALTCDIRVGTDDSKYSLPEVKLGMLPSSGGTQRLTRVVGESRAMHMILTAEKINAETALNWGIITRIVEKNKLESAVLEMATSIAEFAPLAMYYAKKAIRQCYDVPLNEGLKNEAMFSSILLTTDDRQEGIKAFREKRKAKFVGQ